MRKSQLVWQALQPPAQKQAGLLLRSHRPGDIGWVVSRHGAAYAQEYGWDSGFEALVAEIASKFLRKFNPNREGCWIAELDGANAGSAMLVEECKTVAKLRLLLVEPRTRGLGIGARMVQECQLFARQAGYKKIVLWTNNVLIAARRLYQNAGFRMVEAQPHHSFGQDLIGENWELVL